jgi:hypothetical protein
MLDFQITQQIYINAKSDRKGSNITKETVTTTSSSFWFIWSISNNSYFPSDMLVSSIQYWKDSYEPHQVVHATTSLSLPTASDLKIHSKLEKS